MWVKSTRHPELVDSTIVKDGFVMVQSSFNSFSFLSGDSPLNPFKESMYVPALHFLKVHRGHPLRAFSAKTGHLHLAPLNDERMPGRIYADKMAYDSTGFMVVPFDVTSLDREGTQVTKLENCFRAIDGSKSDASLVYMPRESHPTASPGVRAFSFIPPSQVESHFYHWLTERHEISSYPRPVGAFVERGIISIPYEVAREIDKTVMKTLETRYGSRLGFKKD